MNLESLTPTAKQRGFIKTLFARHGDNLSSEELVKAAQDQESPIHDLFMWDNRRAAHLYRLRQAARILRSFTGWLPSVLEGQKKRSATTAYRMPIAVKVRVDPSEPKKWVLTANALENKFMRRQIIEDRITAVRNFIKQLLVVPELVGLHEKLSRALKSYRFPAKKEASGVR